MKTTRLVSWQNMQVVIGVIVVGLTLFAPLRAQASQPFSDDFESDQGWGMFEEIVGGSPCYGAHVGEVSRTADVALSGAHSLRVWANQAVSAYSNHVIAQKQLATLGQTGRYHYAVSAFIAPETATRGETGPELSLQNTREPTPGQFRTATVGIQYRANPFSPLYQTWAVWAEMSPGQANWQTFTTQALTPGAWYTLTVEADYTTNQYLDFWLQGPDLNLAVDLSAYHIAQEAKFTEQAFWLTLESENIYNNCGTAGNFAYQVYYDNVILQRVDETEAAIATSLLASTPARVATNPSRGQKSLFLPLIRH